MNYSVNSAFKNTATATVAIRVLAVNHLIGLVGLNFNTTQALFEGLSWLNLLLSVVVVLLFQQPKTTAFYVFCALAFTVGMAAEMAGVATGFPFGQYYYTTVLGAGVAGVPIIIGLNWILLGYCAAVFVNGHLSNTFLRITGAATLMALLDFLLEPFAIRHHLWVWQQHVPPLQNYLAWFGVALLLQTAFAFLVKEAENRLARPYLTILFLFLITDFVLSFF